MGCHTMKPRWFWVPPGEGGEHGNVVRIESDPDRPDLTWIEACGSEGGNKRDFKIPIEWIPLELPP